MSAVLHQQITGGTKSHTPGRAGEAQHYAANPGRDTKPLLCAKVLDKHRCSSVVLDLCPTSVHVHRQNA